MSRIAYVDGAYVALTKAAVSIEDRGFQFADAVYEVWRIVAGRVLDDEGHWRRLARSLHELQMRAPMSETAMRCVVRETLRRNRVRDGIAYLQISRGAAPRDHAFPGSHVTPTMVVTAKNLDRKAFALRQANGIAVITVPDQRWARCDIKSVSLLPNVLARQAAKEAGAYEAWMVDSDGFVTEGSSSNAWIVDSKGRLRTRSLEANILAGVTRAALWKIAADRQISVDQTPFTVAEAKDAREAFISSAGAMVTPVIRIDGAAIAAGAPGPVTRMLQEAYAYA